MTKHSVLTTLAAVVFLALGASLGFYVGQSDVLLFVGSGVISLQKEFKELDFSSCAQNKQLSVSCVDQVLTSAALENNDASICEKLLDKQSQVFCQERVRRLAVLGDSSLCAGVRDGGLCEDLSFLLLAQESNDQANCANVNSEALQGFCVSLVGPSQIKLIDPAIAGDYFFGPPCGFSDQECASKYLVYADAVKNEDPSLCGSLPKESEQAQCKYEVDFYSVYTAKDPSLCDQFENLELCLTDYAISRALDSSDPNLCNYGDEGVKQGCRGIVERTAEKRFDYLGVK